MAMVAAAEAYRVSGQQPAHDLGHRKRPGLQKQMRMRLCLSLDGLIKRTIAARIDYYAHKSIPIPYSPYFRHRHRISLRRRVHHHHRPHHHHPHHHLHHQMHQYHHLNLRRYCD